MALSTSTTLFRAPFSQPPQCHGDTQDEPSQQHPHPPKSTRARRSNRYIPELACRVLLQRHLFWFLLQLGILSSCCIGILHAAPANTSGSTLASNPLGRPTSPCLHGPFQIRRRATTTLIQPFGVNRLHRIIHRESSLDPLVPQPISLLLLRGGSSSVEEQVATDDDDDEEEQQQQQLHEEEEEEQEEEDTNVDLLGEDDVDVIQSQVRERKVQQEEGEEEDEETAEPVEEENDDDQEEEDDDEGEEDESARVQIEVKVEKYDEPLVPSPMINLYASIGVMFLARKVDLFSPKVVRAARIAYIAYVVLQQLFFIYVRIQARRINDRTPIELKNPLSAVIQSQLSGGRSDDDDNNSNNNDLSMSGMMMKNLASSFLSSKSTVLEYDLKQVRSMQSGVIFNLCFMWFLHFKMGQVQPMLIQTVTGLATLFYSPLFQVYILGRNLERPFGTTSPVSPTASVSPAVPRTTDNVATSPNQKKRVNSVSDEVKPGPSQKLDAEEENNGGNGEEGEEEDDDDEDEADEDIDEISGGETVEADDK